MSRQTEKKEYKVLARPDFLNEHGREFNWSILGGVPTIWAETSTQALAIAEELYEYPGREVQVKLID